MLVKELIAQLQTFSPDLTVMVDGYEGGCSDLIDSRVYKAKVALQFHTGDSHYGVHEELTEWDEEELKRGESYRFFDDSVIVDTVILARGERY